MKECVIQFESGHKLVCKNIIDHVESQEFDVIITKDKIRTTIYKNKIEYMSIKDQEADRDFEDILNDLN